MQRVWAVPRMSLASPAASGALGLVGHFRRGCQVWEEDKLHAPHVIILHPLNYNPCVPSDVITNTKRTTHGANVEEGLIKPLSLPPLAIPSRGHFKRLFSQVSGHAVA